VNQFLNFFHKAIRLKASSEEQLLLKLMSLLCCQSKSISKSRDKSFKYYKYLSERSPSQKYVNMFDVTPPKLIFKISYFFIT
jgi:hypothetical protein